MLERNEKGKELRRYLEKVEERFGGQSEGEKVTWIEVAKPDEMIRVSYENGNPTVMGRDLHGVPPLIHLPVNAKGHHIV